MTNLPQGWEWKSLGEILSNDKYSIKRGPFGSALKKSFFVENGIRVFEQYNAINNDPHWKRYFISYDKFKELEAFKAIEGDLLISCSGTLGKIVELPKNTEIGIINQALLKIRLDNTKILNSYFIYNFNSPIMQGKILESTLGSAIKNIASVKILKQIKIPLPPLQEQERIVGILDESFANIDESIKILEQDLLNLDELMQSALQKAFNPLKDNAKENYQLPQGWEWKSLGDIAVT
ncbi:restriction endonuclease subunit S, partial [Campylobacter volucris]|uniref:restriction endonuclease subunit S n=1 Tax=Campylobacter volucris TaxID=1031542 RepID=UPI0018A02458